MKSWFCPYELFVYILSILLFLTIFYEFVRVMSILSIFSLISCLFLSTGADDAAAGGEGGEGGEDVPDWCNPTKEMGAWLNYKNIRVICGERGFEDFGPYGGIPSEDEGEGEEGGEEAEEA